MNCSVESILGFDGDIGPIFPDLINSPFFNNYGCDKSNDQSALFEFFVEQDFSMRGWLSTTEPSMGSIPTGPATPCSFTQRPMRNIDPPSHSDKKRKRKIPEDSEASTNAQPRSKRQRSIKPMPRATADANTNTVPSQVVRNTKFRDGNAVAEIKEIRLRRTKAAADSDAKCCVEERRDYFIQWCVLTKSNHIHTRTYSFKVMIVRSFTTASASDGKTIPARHAKPTHTRADRIDKDPTMKEQSSRIVLSLFCDEQFWSAGTTVYYSTDHPLMLTKVAWLLALMAGSHLVGIGWPYESN